MWSRGVKRAAEEHLWSLLGPDGPWFLVFGASDDNSTAHFDDGGHAPDDFGDSDSAHRISKVYMKAVNYDPASCVFTFGAVDLFRDSPGANSGFPSQITTRPVYTLHSDRIFWACSLERLECAAGMDGPRSVKFAASGRKITPVILDTIPLRHMSYHRPLVFTDSEADGEAGRGLRDGSSRTAVSRTTSDFWIAEDGSQWVCRKVRDSRFRAKSVRI